MRRYSTLPSMAIIFFDFDSTVIAKESLDEAIALSLEGHEHRDRIVRDIEEITRLGMEGAIDFRESVRRRCAVAPLSRDVLEQTGRAMVPHITTGFERLLPELRTHADVHIVSGGFIECIAPSAHVLDVSRENIHSNRLLFGEDGAFCGIDESARLWTNEGKTPVLRMMREVYPQETFVMVGDGMNDYRAFESRAADYFIGFGMHAVRESVRERAPYFAFTVDELEAYLTDILKKEQPRFDPEAAEFSCSPRPQAGQGQAGSTLH